MNRKIYYAIKTQRKARYAPEGGLWVPWALSIRELAYQNHDPSSESGTSRSPLDCTLYFCLCSREVQWTAWPPAGLPVRWRGGRTARRSLSRSVRPRVFMFQPRSSFTGRNVSSQTTRLVPPPPLLVVVEVQVNMRASPALCPPNWTCPSRLQQQQQSWWCWAGLRRVRRRDLLEISVCHPVHPVTISTFYTTYTPILYYNYTIIILYLCKLY